MAKEEKGRFNWDRHNLGHIAKHKITPEEVEQVLSNDPLFIETQVVEEGEERTLELGHTNARRVLFVLWTERTERIRPITAFPANAQVRTAYFKREKP